MDNGGNKYANRPNLLRVATELTGYKNPSKVLRAMKLVLEGSVEDSTDGQENISLLGG